MGATDDRPRNNLMTDVTHDPLCAMARDTDASEYGWCMCPLISKVRDDERALICNDSAPEPATLKEP